MLKEGHEFKKMKRNAAKNALIRLFYVLNRKINELIND
jgi:hypothetical protein